MSDDTESLQVLSGQSAGSGKGRLCSVNRYGWIVCDGLRWLAHAAMWSVHQDDNGMDGSVELHKI